VCVEAAVHVVVAVCVGDTDGVCVGVPEEVDGGVFAEVAVTDVVAVRVAGAEPVAVWLSVPDRVLVGDEVIV